MEDKLDLRERTPEPKNKAPAPARKVMTPREALKHYGMWAGIWLAAMVWFGYDGWFNPHIEAKGFNKFGAVIFAGLSVFYLVMTGSAALALRRRQQESDSPQS